MDTTLINRLLHDTTARTHYRAHVGDQLRIDLPRIPMTRATEFLQLRTEIVGDDTLEPGRPGPQDRGEGLVSPSGLVRDAVRPGRTSVLVKAVDALSEQEIEGIEPLEITVEVEPR